MYLRITFEFCIHFSLMFWICVQMSEYYYTPSSTSAISNEDSNRKSFQRTYSAQVNDKEGGEHCM